MMRLRTNAAPKSSDEPKFPPAPPLALQPPYFALSRAYVYWCVGMLVWTIVCVCYFVITWQHWNTYIGLCLGVLLVAMIVMPAFLFGGPLWHRRLAWMTILLCLFAVMWAYPLVVVVLGIIVRIGRGTYHHLRRQPQEILHLVVCVQTLAMVIWTDVVTTRAVMTAGRPRPELRAAIGQPPPVAAGGRDWHEAVQRAGRGIRLTDAGRLPAERAAEGYRPARRRRE